MLSNLSRVMVLEVMKVELELYSLRTQKENTYGTIPNTHSCYEHYDNTRNE